MFVISNFVFSVSVEEEEELKKSAVVNWYLKEIESEIDSEEELVNRKGLIEKVIHRLVHYVSVFFLCNAISFQMQTCLFTSVLYNSLSLGSHPHRAIAGWAEGLRACQHRRRSCSGRQPKLHPGGLNHSICACFLLVISSPLQLRTIKSMFIVFVNARMYHLHNRSNGNAVKTYFWRISSV